MFSSLPLSLPPSTRRAASMTTEVASSPADARMSPAALLASVSPYLRRQARFRARRFGVDADDLFQQFAVHVLTHGAAEYAAHPDRGRPLQFAKFWVLRVCKSGAMARERRWHDRRVASDHGRHGPAGVNPIDPGRFPDPADAAEVADDVEAVRRAVGRLTPRRAEAVRLRFGLEGDGGPVVGPDLAGRLGGMRQQSADELVREGLRHLAWMMGSDPAAARVDPGEGRSIGLRRRGERERGEVVTS